MGAGVTLTYAGADLDAYVNVVSSRETRGHFIYIWVVFLEGAARQVVGALTPGLMAILNSVTLTLPSDCQQGANELHREPFGVASWIITYSTACTLAPSAVVHVTANGTVSDDQGHSRDINGSGSGSGGGGGGGGGGGLTEHVVFISTTTTNGNIGGLAGADQLCEDAAAAGSVTQSLLGTWRAIMSDETTSAASRLNFGTGAIKTTQGNTVVASAANLWDGSIAHAIDADENGASLTGAVYTGTLETGASSTGNTCDSWTTFMIGNTGKTGSAIFTDYKWVAQVNNFCSTSARLYCINTND